MAKSGCGTVEHVRMIVWLPRPQSVMVSALDDCDSIDLDVAKLSDDVGNATFTLDSFCLAVKELSTDSQLACGVQRDMSHFHLFC